MLCSGPKLSSEAEIAKGDRVGNPKLGYFHHKIMGSVLKIGNWLIQGVFYLNKIIGVGNNFGLLVHVLPGPNK